jgi:hypothetical protein
MSGHDYYHDDEFLLRNPHIAGVSVAIDEILGKPDQTFAEGSWFKLK